MPQASGNVVLILGLPGGTELIVILLFGLLFFGRRLPDVARSLGKSVVEFKKGIRDIKDEVDSAGDGDDRQIGSQGGRALPPAGNGSRSDGDPG